MSRLFGAFPLKRTPLLDSPWPGSASVPKDGGVLVPTPSPLHEKYGDGRTVVDRASRLGDTLHASTPLHAQVLAHAHMRSHAVPPALPGSHARPSALFHSHSTTVSDAADSPRCRRKSTRPPRNSLGGWLAGTHDSTWPITAQDCLGSIIGLEGGHVTQQTNQSPFQGRQLQQGKSSCPHVRAVGIVGSCSGSAGRPLPTLGAPEHHRWAGSRCHPGLSSSPRENTAREPLSLMLWK